MIRSLEKLLIVRIDLDPVNLQIEEMSFSRLTRENEEDIGKMKYVY